MGKPQLIAIASAVALFLGLFFGCPTQSKEQGIAQSTRKLNVNDPASSLESLVAAGLKQLNDPQRQSVLALDEQLQKQTKKSEQVETLKKLAGAWHNAGRDEVAAFYAQQIAEIEQTDAAWEIAGGNFYLALQAAEKPEIKEICGLNAIKAFENAISLNPKKLEHKVNLAICYAENPPKDNPMKGTLLLLDMERETPGNPLVNYQLGRLGIKTGQFEKAIKRLETALAGNPNDPRPNCLLAQAYEGLGNAAKAAEYGKKCR